MTKKKRFNLALSPTDVVRMQRVRKKLGLDSDHDVIRAALRILDRAVKAQAVWVQDRNGGERCRLEVV